ncbi:MAG: DUF61 family protein [Candidatus Heimdallarchaeota archaeon]|nr:DUF61 family protein [Candidatus Heimdallarchaeota archaeon]
MSEKIIDLIWSLDIERMNDHLPREKKTLVELLSVDQPQIHTKKGGIHRFKKKHLQIVAELIPEKEWKNIKLPIVLLRRTDLEKGLFSISGGKGELYIIYKLLGKTSDSFPLFKMKEHRPYIWKPEAFTAIRKLGSIFVIGYG